MDMIYLDNNATTRPDPLVVEAMLPYLQSEYGNPSSMHAVGQAARHAVENARAKVAALIGARPREIIFTGSGTEADNIAILATLAVQPDKRHIVTTAIEHEAVLRLCQRLETQGYRVTYLPVDLHGRLDAEQFRAALTDDTAIASVMHANNETGVYFPVEELAAIADDRGVPFHVDAVQSVDKRPIDVSAFPVALLSLSAHKIHGPKGVGALYIRRGLHLRGVMLGGHQERDLRPGTENVPAIVGFGVAAELASQIKAEDRTRIEGLRDRLESGILSQVPYAHVIGDTEHRTINTTNIGFEAIEAGAAVILFSENGLCVSAGAACASGSLEASHVLKAMGIEELVAHGGIRFSLSRHTTQAEVDAAIERIPQLTERLRRLMGSALSNAPTTAAGS